MWVCALWYITYRKDAEPIIGLSRNLVPLTPTWTRSSQSSEDETRILLHHNVPTIESVGKFRQRLKQNSGTFLAVPTITTSLEEPGMFFVAFVSQVAHSIYPKQLAKFREDPSRAGYCVLLHVLRNLSQLQLVQWPRRATESLGQVCVHDRSRSRSL